MGRVAFDSEVDRLLTKQANLYRLQQLIDSMITGAANGSRFSFSEELIKRLHHVAMQGLLTEPGAYRTADVIIANSPHQPPPWLRVSGEMQQMCAYMVKAWDERDLIHLAAFTLWRLNWIHPFENGNGRVSRALSYLVLCAKHGAMLPAKNSVLNQIMANRVPIKCCGTQTVFFSRLAT